MGLGVDEARRYDALRALVREAGGFVLDRFGRAAVEFKDDASMVTDVDLAVERWITRALMAAFPGDLAFGEEGLSHGAPRPGCRYVWVVDPIDGTNNFGRGMPGFSVSLGLVREGVVVGGAVYDPLARQLFAAWTGEGAWLNDRRLRVARAPLDRRSLFSIRSPYGDGVPDAVARWLERYRLRRSGSTALQLCYVAMGAISFLYDHQASLWDIAGAAAVLNEAGARLTTPDGAPLFPIREDAWSGAPLALLAGVPEAYESALCDLAVAASGVA